MLNIKAVNEEKCVEKTKDALRKALATIMIKKDLRKITIQELANLADIHRATFYTHYHDIYELYEDLEQTTLSELANIMADNPIEGYQEFWEKLLDFIYLNVQIIQMFSGKNGTRSFEMNVIDFLEQKYMEEYLYTEKKPILAEEWLYYTSYHINGCYSLIRKWVSEDCICPKEKILKMLIDLDKNFDSLF